VIAIFDNVLTPSDLDILKERYHGNGNSLGISWIPFEKIDRIESLIVNLAKNFHGFNKFDGIEVWTQNNTLVQEHIDKDEVLFSRTGEFSFPLCSIILYLEINNLIGGQLICNEVNIKPINNRLVTFAPGLIHSVRDFVGNRLVLAINPWLKRPMVSHE